MCKSYQIIEDNFQFKIQFRCMLYISCIFQLNKKGPQYVHVLTVGLVKMYIYISRELKSALHVHSDIFKRFPVT